MHLYKDLNVYQIPRYLTILACLFLVACHTSGQGWISFEPVKNGLDLRQAVIYVDMQEEPVVHKAALMLQEDIEKVTGYRPMRINTLEGNKAPVIIIGTLHQSKQIEKFLHLDGLSTSSLENKWENYLVHLFPPGKSTNACLLIAGSDRRGTAYGILELSRQLGVSPWNWWADVPVIKQSGAWIKPRTHRSEGPLVKYRGIFLNDEAPALSGWTAEKFGGFNHRFYEKVFELLLRLKANYIWPAMWGHAFYDDDSLNIKVADEYAIVIGTSHHEPLMRAHDEWRRYGKGLWNYDSNEVRLREFWKKGMQRAWNEKIVSIGMRGDGDLPMSRETATALLERIVTDQRNIISEVTGKPASETPQLWALYKEVQDYYDKGMRVPDDVTLLLCDDNWGNIRRLPMPGSPPRKGGYGIYYHFDYVGGPRNYKWLNTNPIPRVWEQMHLAWEYGARQIWIVNVGDLKPMEFPISFFLDYAWNPERISADELHIYTLNWCREQFGSGHEAEIAYLLEQYAKFNGRRKPELLDQNTYSLQYYQEFEKVVKDYQALEERAEKMESQLAPVYHNAFFQLIHHPIKACSNLNELYYYVALNHEAALYKDPVANQYAKKVKELFIKDSLITLEYHQLNGGKWNHLMDQTHIGYTYWQQPPLNAIPKTETLSPDETGQVKRAIDTSLRTYNIPVPNPDSRNFFVERDGYVSIEADHFTRGNNTNEVEWKIIPDLGRTGSAVTSFPVNSAIQDPGKNGPRLEYEFYTYDADSVEISAYFSPTLNFGNFEEGLQYGISIDDESPVILSLNKDEKTVKTWEGWVAKNIIIRKSRHYISKPGKHIINYRMIHPGVVLQKIVVDLGGLKDSYLGPPETLANPF